MSSSKKKCIKTISALMYILKPNLNSKIWFTVPLLGPPLNLILTLFGMKHQHPFLLIVFSVVSVFIITWIWIHYAKEVAEFRQIKYLLWEELYLLKKQSKGLNQEEIENRFNAILEKFET